MYYSYKHSYPTQDLPERIRLSNGQTRTDKDTFTEEELTSAGWIKVEDPPIYNADFQNLIWNGEEWIIKDKPMYEILKNVKERKDYFLDILIHLVERYERETFLELPTTDDYLTLQKLARKILEVEKQENYPFNIEWPVPQDFRSEEENKKWQTPI